MHIVTPETARKLKAAGFPQPQIGPLQFWYLENDLFFAMQSRSGVFLVEVDGFSVSQNFKPGFVYAPSADDILRLLKGRTLEFTDDGWEIQFVDGWGDSFYSVHEIPKHATNSAESGAIAYLMKK